MFGACSATGALFALVACGGGAMAPAQDVTRGPESDTGQMDAAERELDRLFGPALLNAQQPARGDAQPGAAPPPPPPPAATVPGAQPYPSGGAAPRAAEAPDEDKGSVEPVCVTACRALSSMQRAATHLCELAGEPDPQCTNAKDRVQRATDRVLAQCPACAPS
jgi:hypothetical protein